jgi:hypothetical protein
VTLLQEKTAETRTFAANLNSNRSAPNDHYNLQRAKDLTRVFAAKLNSNRSAPDGHYCLQRAKEPSWGFGGKLKFLTIHTKQPL